MTILLFFCLSCIGAYFITGIWRRYVISKNQFDMPNSRSSHTIPTPRGGGIAIVIVFLTTISIFAIFDVIPRNIYFAILGAGGLAAYIGFLDDYAEVHIIWRVVVHLVSAVWALACLDGLPPIQMLGEVVDLGSMGNVLAIIYLVWMLNLYNFMDGIDGIASIEAITVCLGASILYWLTSTAESDWLLPLLLTAAVIGFLYWNFPRAKIFMGDIGSGFLGVVIGILSIHSASIDPNLFWGWLILLGVFIVDSTVTLVRRAVDGKTIYHAHRSHAYQKASLKYKSHVIVSLSVAAINIIWLLPISVIVINGWLNGVAGVLIGYAPLVWTALRFRAGKQNASGTNHNI